MKIHLLQSASLTIHTCCVWQIKKTNYLSLVSNCVLMTVDAGQTWGHLHSWCLLLFCWFCCSCMFLLFLLPFLQELFYVQPGYFGMEFSLMCFLPSFSSDHKHTLPTSPPPPILLPLTPSSTSSSPSLPIITSSQSTQTPPRALHSSPPPLAFLPLPNPRFLPYRTLFYPPWYSSNPHLPSHLDHSPVWTTIHLKWGGALPSTRADGDVKKRIHQIEDKFVFLVRLASLGVIVRYNIISRCKRYMEKHTQERRVQHPPSQEPSSLLGKEEPGQSVCQLLIISDWLITSGMWQAEG